MGTWPIYNKVNLRDLIAATGLVILLKLDLNRRFFVDFSDDAQNMLN